MTMLASLFLVALVSQPASVPPPALDHPQDVAKQITDATRVTHANVDGRYAVVTVADGKMEGSPMRSPILLEHFAFGWQGVALLGDRCPLDARVHDPKHIAALLQGLKLPAGQHCEEDSDSGSATDISAIREGFARFVRSVRVVQNYALANWGSPGGGQALFRKDADGWKRLTMGGGAMSVDDAARYGVPHSIACKLGLYDTKQHC